MKNLICAAGLVCIFLFTAGCSTGEFSDVSKTLLLKDLAGDTNYTNVLLALDSIQVQYGENDPEYRAVEYLRFELEIRKHIVDFSQAGYADASDKIRHSRELLDDIVSKQIVILDSFTKTETKQLKRKGFNGFDSRESKEQFRFANKQELELLKENYVIRFSPGVLQTGCTLPTICYIDSVSITLTNEGNRTINPVLLNFELYQDDALVATDREIITVREILPGEKIVVDTEHMFRSIDTSITAGTYEYAMWIDDAVYGDVVRSDRFPLIIEPMN